MNINSEQTLFIIDGSAFLYRAYYGVKPLHTSSGTQVQAVYSFCRTIKRLIDTFGVRAITIVWDSPGKTTRHQMFAGYKATRQAPPGNIMEQKKFIQEFVELVGIHQIARSGIEADDLMFSVAQEQKDNFDAIILVTGDKDMTQALSEKIRILDPLKNEFITCESAQASLGYSVEKIPFYFALLGDSSDNIPGVAGVGKKTATDIVQRFADLEDLYTNLSTAGTDRVIRLLSEQKENAFLSRDLFLLQNHPLGSQPEDFAFSADSWRNALPFFREFEFYSLLTDKEEKKEVINTTDEKVAFWKKQNFTCVTTTEVLASACAEIRKNLVCAIDTETCGAGHPLHATLVGISLCATPERAYYIPCGHEGAQQLTLAQIQKQLLPIFTDTQIKKYMHNAKYDLLVLNNHHLPIQGLALDTMIAARLVLEESQKVGLKNLSVTYFNEPMLSYKEVVIGHHYASFAQVPLDLATIYAAADARQTLKLALELEPQLVQNHLLTPYQTTEHPLINVLCRMESAGIALDAQLLEKLGVDVLAAIKRLEAEIHAAIPDQGNGVEPINLNSPRQVEKLLFEILELPPQKKSAKGTSYSTDHEVLEKLAPLHPVPGLILKYRELTKLKSTYIEALPTFIYQPTGKIYTNFSQIGAATGRLSSSDPNVQNIPVTGYGIEIRSAFRADPGYVLLSADYSQIELRVLAFLAQEKTLIDAFLSDTDIHAQTAAFLFGIVPEAVSHEQRQVGKRINFSVLYGLTPYGLARSLQIEFSDAKAYIDRYFAQFPAVKTWMETVIESAKKLGYVATYWQRRRYIPAIYEKNKTLYQEACRIAVNTVVQGTAADIMKLGMIKLDAILAQEHPDVRLLLQIHDELLLAVPKGKVAQITALVTNVLETLTPDWNVPLQITTRHGHSWKDVSK